MVQQTTLLCSRLMGVSAARPTDVRVMGADVVRWALAVAGLGVLLGTSALARAQAPSDFPVPSPAVPNLVAQNPASTPAAGPQKPTDIVPAPRRVDSPPAAPSSRPRMEGLPAGVLAPLGTTPSPTPEQVDRLKRYVKSFNDPEYNLDLVIGRPRLMHLVQAPFRVQVADERIMTYTIIGPPTEVLLQGLQVGSTVMTMWFGDRDDVGKQTIISWVVHVLPDPEAKERLERAYKALEDEINRAFPDDYVHLFLVGDKLVVSGEAKDAVEAVKILHVISANAPSGYSNPKANIPTGSSVNLNLNSLVGPDNRAPNTLEDYITSGESNIINLLRIPGEQQVMLKVTVAEVSRAAARSIGLNFAIRNNAGIQVVAQMTGGIMANLPVLIDQGQVNLSIEALKSVNLARSLAEPNLVTLNGHPAQFHAGGEFPVPVVTGATATGLSGVSFVPFGVFLTFTPLITDKDRIRLQIQADVSVRDVATGTNFGTGNIGSTFVPGLTDRYITTTVEMREGQTLAIGGLLQTNLAGDTTRVPFLGDLPFGGQLFRVDHTQASESELVLLVTPELVHPMEASEVPPLPGSDVFEASDLEFYLLGRLESRRSYDYRTPVMSDINRMAAYRHCELLYFVGPHGHCEAPK